MNQYKVLLVGGASHTGKTTLAKALAAARGWQYLTTDQFARHPGRPWRDDARPLPDDLVAHYAGLTTSELVASVLDHYRENVWPIVDAVVRSHLNNPFDPHLVLEGSAILPERVAAAGYLQVRAIWLTASDQDITHRMHTNSRLVDRPPAQQRLIEAYLHRALEINRVLVSAAAASDQQIVAPGQLEDLDL